FAATIYRTGEDTTQQNSLGARDRGRPGECARHGKAQAPMSDPTCLAPPAGDLSGFGGEPDLAGARGPTPDGWSTVPSMNIRQVRCFQVSGPAAIEASEERQLQ